jgi:hypothetical protein
MSNQAVPDIISVVGSAYLQPIADLLEKLLSEPPAGQGVAGSGLHENGYSAATIILLMAVLESYTARVRFARRNEAVSTNLSTPDLLQKYYPELPTKSELIEAFLCRNVVAHNHVWHLEVSDFETLGSPTLATPQELGFQTNKHYQDVVDVLSRRTKILGLNINPIAVDRTDVRKVFSVVWETLKHMNEKSFSDTPLTSFQAIKFRGSRRSFEQILEALVKETDQLS